jgi:hypothetical protein
VHEFATPITISIPLAAPIVADEVKDSALQSLIKFGFTVDNWVDGTLLVRSVPQLVMELLERS